MTTRLRRHIGALTALVVACIVLGPTLWSTGYILHYDMVFVPHLALNAGTLGIDGGVPRAVPNDIVVALASLVLPGWLVERLILVGAFVAIGAGVDAWHRGTRGKATGPRVQASGLVATICSTVVLCWNPWMGERLAIGHWGYLWGYAGLVWALAGGMIWRSARTAGEPETAGRRAAVVGLLMSALSGSTGAVLVLVALVIVLGWPGAGRCRGREMFLGLILWLGLSAAWWFPFVALAPSSVADTSGVRAFAARDDSAAGLLGSLLSGGGIWNEATWFSSRDSLPLVALGVVLVVGGLVGLWLTSQANAWPALAVSGAGLVLGLLGATSGSRGLLETVVSVVPGGGLLRDGQKFVALLIVPAGLGLGAFVGRVWSQARGTLLAPVALLVGVLGPVAALPDLAWAKGGQWASHVYPADVERAASSMRGQGAAAVFPWQLYRQYAWNGERVVLDPWQRILDRRVVVNDSLPLRHGEVRGESPDADAVRRALASTRDPRVRNDRVVAALRKAGVRYTVDQRDQPQAVGAAPRVGRVIFTSPSLIVRDLGAVRERSRPWWASAGLVVTALTLLGCAASPVISRRGSRPPKKPSSP